MHDSHFPSFTYSLLIFQDHESTCKYVSVCCDDCEEVMERRYLNLHKESECDERITDCQYCDEQFPFHALKVQCRRKSIL